MAGTSRSRVRWIYNLLQNATHKIFQRFSGQEEEKSCNVVDQSAMQFKDPNCRQIHRLVSSPSVQSSAARIQVSITNKKLKGNMLCALKHDTMKAYDRLEWPYLKVVMLKLGISPRLTETIMRCVTSVCFSVMLNGGK